MSFEKLECILYPIFGMVLLLLVWHFYVAIFEIPQVVMPLPAAVLDSIIEEWDLLLEKSWPAFLGCVCGFSLAVVLGILIAVAVTESRRLNLIFYQILIATQSVPKVALAPIILVWFGLGVKSKLAIGFFVAFFPMVIDTATGLRSTPTDLIDLARLLRCTRFQIF